MATLDTRTETAGMTLQDLKRAVYGTQKADAVQDATFLKYLNENPEVREDLLSNKDLLEKHDGRKRLLRKNVQALLGEAQEEIHIAAAKERYKKGVEKKGWLRWAAGKVGSAITFPFRVAYHHPILTSLVVLAAYLGLSSQVQNIFSQFAGAEGVGVQNVINKTQELIRSNLLLATGTAGAGNAITNTPIPADPF